MAVQWGLLERRRGLPDAAAKCFAKGVKAAPRNPYLWQVGSWAVAWDDSLAAWLTLNGPLLPLLLLLRPFEKSVFP